MNTSKNGLQNENALKNQLNQNEIMTTKTRVEELQNENALQNQLNQNEIMKTEELQNDIPTLEIDLDSIFKTELYSEETKHKFHVITPEEVQKDIDFLNLIIQKLIEKNNSLKNEPIEDIDYVTDLKHLFEKFYIISMMELIKDDFDGLVSCVRLTRDGFIDDKKSIENGAFHYKDK